jgi:thioredoxin 1
MIVNYFGAKWCGPCKRAKPYIQGKEEELKGDGHEVIFWDIDDDESEDMCERYEISGVPAIIFVKDGEVVGEIRGWNDEGSARFDAIVKENV